MRLPEKNNESFYSKNHHKLMLYCLSGLSILASREIK